VTITATTGSWIGGRRTYRFLSNTQKTTGLLGQLEMLRLTQLSLLGGVSRILVAFKSVGSKSLSRGPA
jgi:hypothetical protein